MNTRALKTFAQAARRQLREQVAARLEQVLQTDSVEIREKERAVKELREQISQTSKEAVIDKVAYTWFNRFCALRFMDVNHYTRVGVVSPVEGFTQPEILQDAKQGIIDDDYPIDLQRVLDLLSGKMLSSDLQGEAYRLLLVGACNATHKTMPFLFQEIEDYTELLMPEDLLSENSILHEVRMALHEDACQDVEVIGWLYQYYISERKDEVFAALKKNKKIEAEDIPAATQLFTPHWIVRYLVENTLGRLWMLNHPNSRLVEQMEYYIRPEEPETDFLQADSPEEIKICDPACGSGHMLTYAFDLLYAIYEEQGYDPVQIPQLILEKNLYGIEIDLRAGHLAGFALTMKAREKDRRFFSRGVEPNICVLRNVSFKSSEINEYMDALGRDLFTEDLWLTLDQYKQAENFGSLIRPALKDVRSIRERLEAKGVFENLFLHTTNHKVEQVLDMTEYLTGSYQIVLSNPPYMGNRGMNESIKEFAKHNYPISKSDSFAMFIVRNLEFLQTSGYAAMITIPSWMFLSSFKKFRKDLIRNNTITSFVDNGRGVWGSDFGSCSFVILKQSYPSYTGTFKRLFTRKGKVNSNNILQIRFKNDSIFPNFYASTSDFSKLPGSPIAFWVSNQVRSIYKESLPLHKFATPRAGMITGNNALFVRLWFEVRNRDIGLDISSREDAKISKQKWFPYQKGGPYRKWFGNKEYVVNWENDGDKLRTTKNNKGQIPAHAFNEKYIFKHNVNWSAVTISKYSARLTRKGALFDAGGSAAFPKNFDTTLMLCGFLNSKIVEVLLSAINPTLNFQAWEIGNLPICQKIEENIETIKEIVSKLESICVEDWNSSETAWDFKKIQLLINRNTSLVFAYKNLRSTWHKTSIQMQYLEEQNNKIFIDAYSLHEELTPEIPLREITLSCNPRHRYPDSSRKTYTEEERESLLLTDTMKEFISYAVGCMFGRYSLDKPGLILANQGETIRDYLEQVPESSFPADDDNVIPVLDEGWFDDDIVERFKRFLRVTFGDEHYEENLIFLENAIGKDVRSYFLKDFYKEHVKMYKKSPIYWLFSSPRGSFNALIYMHRYRPDTISIVLNDYLREYREKLTSHRGYLEQVSHSANASQRDRTKALKENEKVNKVLAELKEYEDEILYPLATRQVEIDLDDGVKVNYRKFGKALKKVSGLSAT